MKIANHQEKRENMKNNMTFNDFAVKYCDRLYTPEFKYEEQCTGYKQLRKMIREQINPATKEECEIWQNDKEQMWTVPDIKYMRFLHPNLRDFVQENWETIKDLKL